MADSGVFRINPLQAWQREAVQKAAQLLRERFGNPPGDAQARQVHDGLLEVLDPVRRTVRLQKEISEATRKALNEKSERRTRERRAAERRKVKGAVPASGERRKGERRSGADRRRR